MIRFRQHPRSHLGLQNKALSYLSIAASQHRETVPSAGSLQVQAQFKVQDFKCWATNHDVKVLTSSQHPVVPSYHTPSPHACPAAGAAGPWSPGSFPRHCRHAQRSCKEEPAAGLAHRPWGRHAHLVQMQIPIPTVLASGVESFRITLHRFQPLWLFQKGLASQ